MARILKNVRVEFNGVNLSAFVREIELSYEVDEKDPTTMADNTILSYPGLKKWRVRGKLLQSFAAGEVDASLFALVGDEVPKSILVRVTNAAISATNPEFVGTGYLLKYPPISGGVGDLHETDVEIGPASDLVRDITP